MHDDDASEAARRVAAFAGRLAGDPHLAAEMQRARREFFPEGPAGGSTVPGAADAAELRFAEWFTLERESEVLGAVPVDVPQHSGDAAEFDDSCAGLWLVQNVTARAVVEARDLQDGSSIDLAVPAQSLLPGDLIVGRLFAAGAGRWIPSTAAAIFRPGEQLAKAFLRDVQRLGLERRLHQVELEHLLLRRPRQPAPAANADPVREPAVPLEHLEADLDALLARSASEHTATAISQQLALAVRPGPVIGPLLDELAFDTELDLDVARELMVAIWNAHHGVAAVDGAGDDAAADTARSPSGETLGERLVRMLDEGLAQKRDVGELFAQLERAAGIEPEPEESELDDDEGDDDDGEYEESGAPPEAEATKGNLAALVEEYLWETERAATGAATALRTFAQLQENAALPHRDLEEIDAADVMRLLLHVYLGAPPAERAARVRATFESLGDFYRWASEVQEMEVGSVLASCRGALLDQLDRLQAASDALSATASVALRPGVLVVEEVSKQGFGVRDDDGNDHWLAGPPQALSHLHAGDLVLGALAPADGTKPRTLGGLVVVLPADARALME
jgi:hypothetical protein